MSTLNRDPYFDRQEVSNSDLSWLAKYWLAGDLAYDIDVAYRFGTLIDCMITEPHKVNFFKFTVDGDKYTKDEFRLAEEMKAAFFQDPFCKLMAENSEMQSIVTREDFEIEHEGFRFTMAVRLKFDLDARKKLKMTGDIKSTTAKTEKEFIAACHHFGYFRQRAWYMDISKSEKDVLIGISKVNKKVFKIPIAKGGEFYNIGKEQYQELAFKHWYLFGDLSNVERMPELLIAV